MCVGSSTFEAVATNRYGVQEARLRGKDFSASRRFAILTWAHSSPAWKAFRINIKIKQQPLNAFARAKAISDGGADVNRAKYDIGDRMQAAFASSEVSAFGGFAPLPTAGPDGRCVDTNYMRYRVPVTSNSCPRRGTCEGAFDHAAYISDLRVKASYANNLATSQRRAKWIKVDVVEANVVDLGTGTVKRIALDSNTSLPATVHDSTGGICANALLGVRYTMYDATDATVARSRRRCCSATRPPQRRELC